MLWLIPELFEPKSSEVNDTAVEIRNPEQIPINPVATHKSVLWSDNTSRRKAIGSGTSESINIPVLVVYIPAFIMNCQNISPKQTKEDAQKTRLEPFSYELFISAYSKK